MIIHVENDRIFLKCVDNLDFGYERVVKRIANIRLTYQDTRVKII